MRQSWGDRREGLQSPKDTPVPSEEKCRWTGTGRGAQLWGPGRQGSPGEGKALRGVSLLCPLGLHGSRSNRVPGSPLHLSLGGNPPEAGHHLPASAPLSVMPTPAPRHAASSHPAMGKHRSLDPSPRGPSSMLPTPGPHEGTLPALLQASRLGSAGIKNHRCRS